MFALVVLCYFAKDTVFSKGFYISSEDSVTALFADAIQLQNENKFEQAEKKLHQLVILQPAYIDTTHGSAWYVLGKVLYAQNKVQQALQIWFAGVKQFQNVNNFDPFLGDAFIRQAVLPDSDVNLDLITETFYRVLEEVNTAQHREILKRIYEQSVFFLPEEIRNPFEALFYSTENKSKPGHLLRQFWRKQDLTPATMLNERLIEHLQRVEYARIHFPADHVRGFDERGKIYVRFGPPSAKASAGTVGLDTSKDNPKIYNFKPHEAWLYKFPGMNIFFPFVDFEDGKGYVQDRIDKAVTFGSYSNGETKSLRGDTLEIDARFYFYDQLAKSNPVFKKWIKQLADNVEDNFYKVKNYMRFSSTTQTRKIKTIHSTASLDFHIEALRLDKIPEVASEVLADDEDLPMVVRTARFLQGDGATRLELYFGIRKDDLMLKDLQPLLPTDTLKVQLAMTVEDKNYWLEETQINKMVTILGDEYLLAPDTLLMQADIVTNKERFFVSGQVESALAGIGLRDKLAAKSSVQKVALNSANQDKTLLKLTSFRTGIQNALQQETSRFLLSDLQFSEIIIPGSEKPSHNKGDLFMQPFPYRQANRQKPLYLYFEIYGLKMPPDGLARYRVAFEAVQVKTKRSVLGKLKSIFSGSKQKRIELDSKYSAEKSNTREWLALDLNTLSKGEIKLTVKVTDLLRNKTAERSVKLGLF